MFETFRTTITKFGSVCLNFLDEKYEIWTVLKLLDKTRNLVFCLKLFGREIRNLVLSLKPFARDLRNLALCLKLSGREYEIWYCV